jgi:hypothetical protein
MSFRSRQIYPSQKAEISKAYVFDVGDGQDGWNAWFVRRDIADAHLNLSLYFTKHYRGIWQDMPQWRLAS